MNCIKKVAIIIPTLNEERFIAQCLDSVINQNFILEEMDIMVVDGGSKDKTQCIVEEYGKKYANIRLLQNPKRIQSVAFNIGVANSEAPIVVRLDAHAEYDKSYIAKCVENHQCAKYGNVGGKCIISLRRENIWSKANVILNAMRFGIGGAAFRVSNKKALVDTVPFGCFTRKVLNHVGKMNETLPRGEDNEFNFRIRKAGYSILFDPEIIAIYYARETFKESVKQMFANGFSIGVLFHACPKSIGLRHFVPFLFICSIITWLLLALINPMLGFCILGLEMIIYLITDICASLIAAIREEWKVKIVLPLLVLSVHMAYGIGTIKGLVKKKY